MNTSKQMMPSDSQRIQLAYDNAPHIVFWVDHKANICQVNEAACRRLGYSRKNFCDMTIFDIDLGCKPLNWKNLSCDIKHEGIRVFASTHRTKGGKILPAETTAIFFDIAGEDHFCFYVRKMERQRAIDDCLHENNKHQLELFFSQSLEGFFFMMLDEPIHWNDNVDKEKMLDYVFGHQRITKVNDAMLDQYKTIRKGLLGLTPNDLFKHDILHGRSTWRTLFDQGHLHIETNERKADGDPMWIEGDYICLYDDQHRIVGHFGIQRDVTEIKQSILEQARLTEQVERYATELEERVAQRTAELGESEARLRAILEAIPDIVFIVDEDGRYIEILTADKDLLHMDADMLKGKHIRDVVPPSKADLFLGSLRQAVQNGKGNVIEYQLNVHAGQRWFEGRTEKIKFRFDGKQCVIFIARDITNRKRAKELEHQNIYLREQIQIEYNYGEIIGKSKAIKDVYKNIEMVSTTDATVMLTGETGTGKELIAHTIHSRSHRSDHTMIKIDCGTIPHNLAESELFGHEQGAFTGATTQKKGKFELADKGTIFLDEIGELPHPIQTKLLRVLQEQEFERVGGTKTVKVDVRVIAATNRDLHALVEEGAFRSDLFFRLNIFPISSPPLRTRIDDIPLLANFFINAFSRRMDKRIRHISQTAMDKLMRYGWPGNVRELANILERAIILCRGNVLEKEHISGLTHLQQTEKGAFPAHLLILHPLTGMA